MHRTFYAFFALMAMIGISSSAIESAKNTAYGSQRAHHSHRIYDRGWEFVNFQGDHMTYADIGGDPMDQRLGADPVEAVMAVAASEGDSVAAASTTSDSPASSHDTPQPIDYAAVDYAALDAGADPITGEKYGCGLGQPIEPVANPVAVADSTKANPWANVCPVGLPSNYDESTTLDANANESNANENEVATSGPPAESSESDPYLDWDCNEYLREFAVESDAGTKGWPAPADSTSANEIAASEPTPGADYTLSSPAGAAAQPLAANELAAQPLASQLPQEDLRFECPEFVLEYLRQFSTAMQELEDYSPDREDAQKRIAEEYAAAENAAALAELRQTPEEFAIVQPALPSIPANQCQRPDIAYNELGYPSCGGYSPDWQQDDSTLSLATEPDLATNDLASNMKIESVDPVVDPADDRWIGPEADLPQTPLIDKVDGPLPALPCDLEVESPEDSNSLANLMRLIVTLDPNLKMQGAGPAVEGEFELELDDSAINGTLPDAIGENGLWSGCDFDFPGCDDLGEPIVTQNGWTKEALALDDAESDHLSTQPEAGAKLEYDPILAWLGDSLQIAWTWGSEALASLHRPSEDVSSARSTWLETR